MAEYYKGYRIHPWMYRLDTLLYWSKLEVIPIAGYRIQIQNQGVVGDLIKFILTGTLTDELRHISGNKCMIITACIKEIAKKENATIFDLRDKIIRVFSSSSR